MSVEVLGSIGPPAQDAVPVLFEMLKDRYDRAMAFEALREIQPRSLSILRKALDNRHRFVRVFACECLGKLGAEARELTGELEQLRDEDDDARVRRSASDALAKIRRASSKKRQAGAGSE